MPSGKHIQLHTYRESPNLRRRWQRHANHPNLLSFYTYTNGSTQPFTIIIAPLFLAKPYAQVYTRSRVKLASSKLRDLFACFASSVVTCPFKPLFPSLKTNKFPSKWSLATTTRVVANQLETT